MTPEPAGERSRRPLLRQLHKRKLVQWAIAYVAGAWLLLQVIDVVGPRWGLTEFLSRSLDVVLVVGFAVTLVLAWYHGEQGRQRVSGVELLILAALALLGGIGLRLIDVEEAAPPEIVETAEPAAATPVEVPVEVEARELDEAKETSRVASEPALEEAAPLGRKTARRKPARREPKPRPERSREGTTVILDPWK